MDAPLYDELHRVEQTHWWFRARRQIVWSLVEKFSGGPTCRLRVCELGCGTGGNLAGIADRHDVTGVECAPPALHLARRTLGDRVIHGHLPHDIDLPRESFDVVLLLDVLEHIQDDAASARTAVNLLRPGGILVATVPAYQWLYAPRDAHHHHVRRYSRRQFTALWEPADTETLLLSHYNALLFAPAAAARIASKFLRDNKHTGDLKTPPAMLNSLLTTTFAAESSLLGRVPLPFGLSLVAVVRKLTAAERAQQLAA